MTNTDNRETEKFDRLARSWWDTDGPLKTLHDINPFRLAWVSERATLRDRAVLDIGCGGGIFSEALARSGARVTAIDLSTEALAIARQHAAEQELIIDYRQTPVEHLVTDQGSRFDVITCMELLEHVPDPFSVIQAASALLKPGGEVFFSTINRNAKAWLLTIMGAEYLLRLVPAGTHRYDRFIRPSELAGWCSASGLQVRDITGMGYLPGLRKAYTSNPDVNYILQASHE